MAELPRPLPPPTWRDRIESIQGGWAGRVPRGIGGLAVVVLIVAVVSVLAALALTGGLSRGGAVGSDIAMSLPTADTSSVDAAAGVSPPAGQDQRGALHVHAAGAVAQPGVVVVPAGSRVTDVVAAAGGPAPDADLDQVNLAAAVSDGERVYVPRRGETAVALAGALGGAGGKSAEAVVNINQADAAALEALPGVGPATAKAIIDYRTEHGRFKSIDELLNVRGIGPSKLSEIKPHARV